MKENTHPAITSSSVSNEKSRKGFLGRIREYDEDQVVNYWLDNVSWPSDTDEEDFEIFLLSYSCQSDALLDDLISTPLKKSLSLVNRVLISHPDTQLILATLLERLISLKGTALFLESRDAEGYFSVSNHIALKRIEVLMAVCNSQLGKLSFPFQAHEEDKGFDYSLSPTPSKEIPKKELLAWARMPIILWDLQFNESFTRIEYFKHLGGLLRTDVPDKPDSNISIAISKGNYHTLIDDISDFIDKYAKSYNQYQIEAAMRSGSSLPKDELVIRKRK